MHNAATLKQQCTARAFAFGVRFRPTVGEVLAQAMRRARLAELIN
jgi:hypothetical protein